MRAALETVPFGTYGFVVSYIASDSFVVSILAPISQFTRWLPSLNA